MRIVLPTCFALALLLAPIEVKAQAQNSTPPPATVPVLPNNLAFQEAEKWYTAALTGTQLSDTRISLDLKDSSIRDAFKKALEAAKLDYEIDDDLPKDRKITLKVDKVRLASLLDVIAQNAGVGWHTEFDKGKTKIHVGKKVPQTSSLYSALAGRTLSLPKGTAAAVPYGQYRLSVPPNSSGLLYNFATTEQRSTFTCPHCKAQTTIIQKKQQPTCPTCQRAFQSGWKVCPYDGAKRPPDPAAWKFCPVCGKAVSSQETAEVPTFFSYSRYNTPTFFSLTLRS